MSNRQERKRVKAWRRATKELANADWVQRYLERRRLRREAELPVLRAAAFKLAERVGGIFSS